MLSFICKVKFYAVKYTVKPYSSYVLFFFFSMLTWSDDETICARCVTNEIHFFENGNFGIYFIFPLLACTCVTCVIFTHGLRVSH